MWVVESILPKESLSLQKMASNSVSDYEWNDPMISQLIIFINTPGTKIKGIKGRIYPMIGMTGPSEFTTNFTGDVEPFKYDV